VTILSSLHIILAAAAAQFAPSNSSVVVDGVRTFPKDMSVCPSGPGDCRLTLVDHALCSWLAELLTPTSTSDTFAKWYNCLSSSKGAYVCVNVLTARKVDRKTETDFADPHLLELASLYENELNQCLPRWTKSKSLAAAGPALLYEDEGRMVMLSIIPFTSDGVRYDRLTLDVKTDP
jgi:hypothetical protein